MITTCGSCNTSFNLDETLVKPTGTKVRCSKCKHVFVVYPPPAKAQPPKPDETAPQPLAGLDGNTAREHGETELAPQPKAKPGETQERTPEDDLSDLDIDLDFDEAVAGELSAAPSEDLDLSELDKIFEDLEAPETIPAKPAAHGIEPVAASEGEPEDELDLSDLEKMLEVEETPADAEEELDLSELGLDFHPQQDQKTETAAVSDDLDLELDLDWKGSEGAPSPSEAEKMDSGDLEVKRDADLPAAETDETEIDLSDLGLDLEAENAPEAPGKPSEPESVDDDLDMVLSAEPVGPEEKEINLSEIERLMETEGALGDPESQDTAREATAVSQEETSGDAEAQEADLPDLDISKFDDMELTPSEAVEKPAQTDTARPAGTDAAREPEEAPEAQSPKAQKKVGRAVMAFLIVAILLVGGYGAVMIMNNMGIEIPYVSQLLNPQPQDTAGNLKIETTDVKSRFIQNENAGKLFIITGNVKNEYSTPRSFIRLTAKLFTKGKVLVASKSVFAGNVLNDSDLTNQKMSVIDKKFENRFGDNHVNLNLAAGGKEPFMAVFSNLPEKLEEFTIEVTGSMPGK